MSIASVITCGFGVPGSASLVITDGYSTAAVAPPVVTTTQTGGGGSRRRRGRVIRYSDFESREELERAMRVVLAPVVVPEPIQIEDDEDDDVVANLLMMMH